MSVPLPRFKSTVPLKRRFGDLHVIRRERPIDVFKGVGALLLRSILCTVWSIVQRAIRISRNVNGGNFPIAKFGRVALNVSSSERLSMGAKMGS